LTTSMAKRTTNHTNRTCHALIFGIIPERLVCFDTNITNFYIKFSLSFVQFVWLVRFVVKFLENFKFKEKL
jgi:hypothetical protein